MTTLETRTGHPLAMTTEAEVRAVREVLARRRAADRERPLRVLRAGGAAKDEVLAHADGDEPDRRFRAVLLDIATGRSWDTVVSTTRARRVAAASSTRRATASRRSSTPSSR